MANDFTGRILKITATGVIPFGNFTVEGGNWTGAAAAALFTVVDEAGRTYTWTFPADGSEVTFRKMPFSGPLTITAITGEVNWSLASK
jgi:hypothetical protein